MDPAGNLYILETQSHIVRKVSGGVISTIAGNGTPGYSGDGGAAASAQLWYPQGLALDAAGDVYIADTLNQRVRVLTPTGVSARMRWMRQPRRLRPRAAALAAIHAGPLVRGRYKTCRTGSISLPAPSIPELVP